MAKLLYIDIGLCSECKGCIEIAPDIFQFNNETGYMEVIDSKEYDEQLVEEAMKNCPEKCIIWDLKSVACRPIQKKTISDRIPEVL